MQRLFLLIISVSVIRVTIDVGYSAQYWAKTYGGSGDDKVFSIQPTSDGGYIAVGESGSLNDSGTDIYVLKLDNNGNILWQKSYGRSDT